MDLFYLFINYIIYTNIYYTYIQLIILFIY
jgi:hypothetical protein